MIITKGTVLILKNNMHASAEKFVVDRFDVVNSFTRVIDAEGFWLSDAEIEQHYEIDDAPTIRKKGG